MVAAGECSEPTKCESGGIGRRTRLRIWRGNPWGFESPLSHQSFGTRSVPPRSFASLRVSPAGSDARNADQVRVPPFAPELRDTIRSSEVLRCAQDFACGLGRPQRGSSSSPPFRTRVSGPDPFLRGPSLRSGFRLRARTPATRLKFESPLSHQSFEERSGYLRS